MDRLTDEALWEDYWKSKKILKIEGGYAFSDLFELVNTKINQENKTSLELGGFPGYFSVYLNKAFQFKTSMLDFYFNKDFFEKVLEVNEMGKSDIGVIQDDLFNVKSHHQYDFVFSMGLIEHFGDSRAVLENHVKFLKKNSVLMIEVPNLLGMNGLVQYLFDRRNYNLHNIEAMRLDLIRDILNSLGLIEIESGYYPSTQVWLEDIDKRSRPVKVIIRIISSVVMPFLRMIFGTKNKFCSDSIYWIYEKK